MFDGPGYTHLQGVSHPQRKKEKQGSKGGKKNKSQLYQMPSSSCSSLRFSKHDTTGYFLSDPSVQVKSFLVLDKKKKSRTSSSQAAADGGVVEFQNSPMGLKCFESSDIRLVYI